MKAFVKNGTYPSGKQVYVIESKPNRHKVSVHSDYKNPFYVTDKDIIFERGSNRDS